MAIDFKREEQMLDEQLEEKERLDEEMRARDEAALAVTPKPAAKHVAREGDARPLPVGALRGATNIAAHMAAEQAIDQDSAVKATGQGFVKGAAQGVARAAVQASTLDLPGGSPISGLIEVAEAAEAGLAPQVDLGDRMTRFPELKGVEVATGNAARFPELAPQSPRPAVPEQEQDGGLER